MKKVMCRNHGEQDETYVCQHIVQGLAESTPYGFWWASDTEQKRPDAWCTLCNDLVAESGGEWTEDVLEVTQVKLLFAACYDDAKRMNIAN